MANKEILNFVAEFKKLNPDVRIEYLKGSCPHTIKVVCSDAYFDFKLKFPAGYHPGDKNNIWIFNTEDEDL